VVNNWLKRWQGLAPREQWLVYAVGLALLGMLYLLLLGDPLTARVARQQAAIQLAEGRNAEAVAGLAELQAKLAADPNTPYHSALLVASTSRDELVQKIAAQTASMITPEKMREVLQALLRQQEGLRLVGLESFSEPVLLAAEGAGKSVEKPAEAPVRLYRHGLELRLEGGFFDLLRYLESVQQTQALRAGAQGGGWKLNWDSLDYRVGEAGPGRAQISLKLYTLSSQAGWVGV
jgi:MSHA biogenesis protein MshJ